MGKADSVTKVFLRDNEVFADAFNYLILEKGEMVNMCKAWDDHWKNGKQAGICEGEIRGLVFSVRNVMKKLNMSPENAVEFLDIPKEQQKDIVKLLQSA